MLLKDSFAAPLTDVKSLRKGKQVLEYFRISLPIQGEVKGRLIGC